MNRATIIGFVEREPELRRTADGQPVTALGVSTNRRGTTDLGRAQEVAEWFHLVAWGKLALAARRLRRDQRIYAEGCIQTRGWDDPDGQRCYLTELVASKLIPVGDCGLEQGEMWDEEDGTLCLNRITVIGNLGRDPEMRHTPAGQAVTCFSLASTRTWTASGGERHEPTEWFSVVSWGSLAEVCHQYLTKGRRVYVEGEMRTRCWDPSNGCRHRRTELYASEMIMLGPRPNSDSTNQPLR